MGEPLASPRRSNATASSSASSRLTTTASPGTTSVSAPSTTMAAPSSAVWGRNSPTVHFAGHCFHPGRAAQVLARLEVAHSTFRSARPLNPASSNDHLRTIIVSGRHLRDIVDDCWEALAFADNPPSLFEFGGTLAEVRRVDGAIKVEALSITALKGRLDRVANFMKLSRDQQRLLPARPPTDAVEDMLALDVRLPHLSGITGAPVFDENWNLVDSPGLPAIDPPLLRSRRLRSSTRVPETPSGEDRPSG